MPMPTMLDIAKSTGSDGIAGLIEEVAPSVPEIDLIPVKPIKGTEYKANIRTRLPQGGFRNANEGIAATKSNYEQKMISCHIANSVWLCDKAVADAHEDGRDAYIAAEAYGVTLGQFVHVGKQIYYGEGNDQKGFPGLNVLYNAAEYTLSAGGSTANQASSVWFLKFGPMGAQLAMGNDAALTLSELKEIVTNDALGNPYTAYHQELLAHIGLLVASKHAAGRICNLTTQAGKGLTDALLGEMLSRFPVGLQPDAIMMTRRSREQLRASRTATTATGAEAPTPKEFEGVPIVATDSLVNTEAIVA